MLTETLLFGNDVLLQKIMSVEDDDQRDNLLHNLVSRSHSVTENVRSGKVRQYTIFHWLLKKFAATQSTLRLAYFAGHLVKVWFSQAHVPVVRTKVLCFPTPEKVYS